MSWTSIKGNSSSSNVYALALVGSNIYIASSSTRIYRTTNDGQSWELINTGMTSSGTFRTLLVGSTDLYAGSYGCGIWRRPLSEILVGVEESRPAAPSQFRLEQNYPNPFNPKTMLKYTMGGTRGQGLGASKTMLVVYDLLGREVAMLVDEVKAPGSYEVPVDGAGLASGMYIYRLTAGSFVQSKTMVLLK